MREFCIAVALLLVVNTAVCQDDDSGDGNTITSEQVERAAEQARNDVRNINNLEDELRRRGLGIRRGSPAYFHQALFRGDPEELSQARWRGIIGVGTAQHLVKNCLNMTLQGRRKINQVSLEDAMEEACPRTPVCNPTRYRSADGSCNNLENIAWGKSYTPYVRWLPAAYDDNYNSPRTRGTGGVALPNARRVSTIWSPDMDTPSNRYSELLMQWGQFLDHDITNTAATRDNQGIPIVCCPEEIRSNASLRHVDCFAIDIPRDDLFYSNLRPRQDCMEFTRSMAAPVERCRLGQRQQMNIITGFIDGSVVYGSTVNQSRNLRSFEGGRLRSSPQFGSNMMPADDRAPCGNADEGTCFAAGDNRVNENTLLTVFHQIWFREHNRIAGILAGMNPGWNDEILYQESRRIVAAMMQHITYNEFLPILLGQRAMAAYGLNVQSSGFTRDYNKEVNPTISNVFAGAAYRLGHTLVQGWMNLVTRSNQVSDRLDLSTQFFTPEVMYDEDSFDQLSRGLAITPSQSFDRFFTDQLTNFLFQTPGNDFGLDLVAINIQRGRDHGLPGYGEWRRYCNLPDIRNFDELSEVMGSEISNIFRRLYRDVQDIDLYVSSISENPVRRDALIGPTLTCLLARQFQNLKIGDRFWYENGKMESSFRSHQLQEIRKVTLARVMCDNTNIQAIQRNAFRILGRRNPVEPCIQGNIPRMSLEPWRNEPIWSRK